MDEEVLDFWARVQTALDEENFPLNPIDPVGWVTSGNYMGSDYELKVEEWLAERKESVSWLRSLENPDWSSSLDHPTMGTLTAGHFLANWLAHDQLHIRQINGYKRGYLEEISVQDLSYAGKW
ncbi:MAG: DinB family protein [Cytophagales bacterium]|nr:DinB family protein [Cytophagales bacterium]